VGYYVMAWALVAFGLTCASVSALNLVGIARGRLRMHTSGRIPILGLGMAGAGLAGFFWPSGQPDASPETWHFYWAAGWCAGCFLMTLPGAWRWFSQGAGNDRTSFFPRVYTSRAEWQPGHVVLIAAYVASVFVLGAMSEGWLSWAAVVLFMALTNSLRILPIHRGRRPPESPGTGPQP